MGLRHCLSILMAAGVTSNSVSPFQHYLLHVFSDAKYMPSLGTFWGVRFDGLDKVSALAKSNATATLQAFEEFTPSSGWTDDYIGLTRDVLQVSHGCVFAREVSLPGEEVSAGHGPLNYGGYIGPAVFGDRSSPKNVNMKLLETNKSFIDLILRPWAILAGYYGLVTRDNLNVKCPQMVVTQYMMAGQLTPRAPRKEFTFHNVVPVSVGSTTLTQQGEGILTADVSFIYDHYSVTSTTITETLALVPV